MRSQKKAALGWSYVQATHEFGWKFVLWISRWLVTIAMHSLVHHLTMFNVHVQSVLACHLHCNTTSAVAFIQSMQRQPQQNESNSLTLARLLFGKKGKRNVALQMPPKWCCVSHKGPAFQYQLENGRLSDRYRIRTDLGISYRIVSATFVSADITFITAGSAAVNGSHYTGRSKGGRDPSPATRECCWSTTIREGVEVARVRMLIATLQPLIRPSCHTPALQPTHQTTEQTAEPGR